MLSPKEFLRSTLTGRRASSRRRGPSLGMEQLENRLALSAVTVVIRHGQDSDGPSYGTRQENWNIDLKTAINSAQTTLSAKITSKQTTINVTSDIGFPPIPFAPFGIKIKNERMLVTASAPGPNNTITWTVQRGWYNTPRASYSSGAVVAGSRTMLTTAIDDTTTEIIVPYTEGFRGATEGFPRTQSFPIQIDNERMMVTANTLSPDKKTITWTVERGTDGTTAAAHLKGATVTPPGVVVKITPSWFEANADKIPPKTFYTNTTRLGLPKKVINGTSFRLSSDGTKAAQSYKTVLPNLLSTLGKSPISRVMVDSFARPNQAIGTPNPLDTALPFIIDTAKTTPLAVDMVVLNSAETEDKMAWKHGNVTQRLKPLPSDTGSVLIVSTVQGLWSGDKVNLQSDSITGNLISQYNLSSDYLGASKWQPVPNAPLGSFGKVIPQKGTTIYVYGELNNNPADGNEVYVYSQNASNKTFTFLGG